MARDREVASDFAKLFRINTRQCLVLLEEDENEKLIAVRILMDINRAQAEIVIDQDQLLGVDDDPLAVQASLSKVFRAITKADLVKVQHACDQNLFTTAEHYLRTIVGQVINNPNMNTH